MEVEDDDETLQRLFFKKFGRALPEKKSDDFDLDMDLIDLTEEQEEMDATPTLAPVVIVKTESIEIADSNMPAVKPAVNPVIAVESHTPEGKTQDPEGRFSLRQTPSRVASEELRQKEMENKNLFKGLTKCSAETSSAGAFSFGTASFNFKTAESKTLKDYTSKEKADRLQEMKREETQAEAKFPKCIVQHLRIRQH